MRRRGFLKQGLAASLSATAALTTRAASAEVLTYEPQPVTHWRIGLVLKTPVTCTNVLATFPVPTDWPEQKVTVRNQTVDPKISRWQVRDLGGGTKQVVLQAQRIPAGSETEMLFEVDIERARILPPESTDQFVIPPRISRDLRLYTGNSPFIDASHRAIRTAAAEIQERPAATAWERVEQIYDFVRDKVEYVEGDLKNASQALEDGKGDCEEMTSLFVALCRNLDIPARVVWIPDHCYPEFYLEDGEGNGTWFPCQAAGTRQFGRMDETRPVLQKGDRFKIPEKRQTVRYVSEFFQCDRRGSGTPEPTFVRESFDV
ncbi:transglutaminase domain-containing protein [Roseiconus nitratireducens]|uniref:Transglutaminase domain-containing protein n=1 Tax=Roseiconus nitratireducens TaxID=2605748 RepID=A0A5M6D0Z4_9BACT|nr:transglutaminase domain-containing protein [Roseiconus nitratireducens]KAA5540716.1 transglutaminase domain-containing protein [Roseiconus nitratireducens]